MRFWSRWTASRAPTPTRASSSSAQPTGRSSSMTRPAAASPSGCSSRCQTRPGDARCSRAASRTWCTRSARPTSARSSRRPTATRAPTWRRCAVKQRWGHAAIRASRRRCSAGCTRARCDRSASRTSRTLSARSARASGRASWPPSRSGTGTSAPSKARRPSGRRWGASRAAAAALEATSHEGEHDRGGELVVRARASSRARWPHWPSGRGPAGGVVRARGVSGQWRRTPTRSRDGTPGAR
mmetsp:Transcript_26955/g.89720  ORF Transcript_26955/g.89720 Transcript_26955/m.89720 type:complete len:241 (+) Transcript_26955:484-1206(+)